MIPANFSTETFLRDFRLSHNEVADDEPLRCAACNRVATVIVSGYPVCAEHGKVS